jgi:hypothetical protein
VPTQTSDTSEAATAPAASVVARRRPAPTISPISSPTPASTIGLLPSLMIPTFVALTSTPVTSWPSRAKHAADTQPT